MVAQTKRRQRLNVAWYGGGQRDVEVVTGTGHWYRSGAGWRLRWVWVHDCTGTHRDEYFFTTAVDGTAAQVIETYTGRWNLETTFEEMRSCLGLETTRGWTATDGVACGAVSVRLVHGDGGLLRRLAVVAAWGGVLWPGKQDVTFSDALTAVRRWLWLEWVFAIPGHSREFSKLSRPFQHLLLAGLTPAP